MLAFYARRLNVYSKRDIDLFFYPTDKTGILF